MTELYLFTEGATEVGYTSSLLPKSYGGLTYYPVAGLKRSDIQVTENSLKNNVTLTFPKSVKWVRNLFLRQPEAKITLLIRKDGNVFWQGIVSEIQYKEPNYIVNCDFAVNRLNRKTNGGKLAGQCWKTFGDTNCGVDKEDFKETFTGLSLSGISFTLSGLTAASGTYNNGYCTISGQTRRVLTQVGTAVTLAEPFNGTVTGTLSIYRICNLTEASCATFSNLPNCGCFSYIADKNPFNGGSLL
jgi:Uncharacterized conserved protein (DUF2163).